jgi:hypothetical protein
MDHNLDNIAQELYGKIRTRFNNVKMGDENGTVLSKKEDIPQARFFEFEYVEGGQPLGTITITLDSDDGVVVQASGDLIKGKHGSGNIYKFFKSLGQFAKDRLLNIKIDTIGKSNLDKRDYEFQAKRKEPEMTPMMENKMFGTAKISYQDLGEVRLVVKHSQPINTELPAGRTMHIDSIYIENAQGERFRYPYKHLNGARALAEHIKSGGTPYDEIGRHISGLSEELGQLRKFKNYVGRQAAISEAMGDITSKVMERIDQVKKEIHDLQRPTYYKSFVESFTSSEEKQIPEEIMNDWIDRLTIRTFNEELKTVFPYIYNLVGEEAAPIKDLSADDLLNDAYNPNSASAEHRRMLDKHQHDSLKAKAEADDATEHDKKRYQNYLDRKAAMRAEYDARMERESLDPELAFESYMDSIIAEDDGTENTLFSPNKDVQNTAIEKLNDIIGQELKGGPEGTNAIQSLKGLIDAPDFVEKIKDNDPDLDVRALVYDYVSQQAPEILSQLNFPSSGEGSSTPPAAPEAPAPAPAEPAAAAPAPAPEATPPAPAPVAEEMSDIIRLSGLEEARSDYTAAEMTAMLSGQKTQQQVDAEAEKTRGPDKGAKKESQDEDPPFDPDPKPHGKTTAGKHGQEYSQARHLARQGLQQAIAKAKKAGAKLDTKLDFGHKEMTLQDAIEECGMTPMECGFEPDVNGLNDMLKFVSGFYNRDEGNFPLGGQRVKIKVKKGFEDGAFEGATPEDLMKVLKFIDAKDPSGNDHNQIMRLAGVNRNEETVDEAGQMPDIDALMQKLQAQVGNVKTTSTQTGSINGQPAQYDDAMNKIKQMKLKIGDQEIDPSDPQAMQGQIGGIMKGMMGNAQSQMPNQNVQFPGGQMNPADMMKQIMQKINFGN